MSEFKVITAGGKHYVYKGNGYTPGIYLTNTGEVRQIDLCDILDQYYFPSHEAAQAALDKYLSSTRAEPPVTTILVDGKPVYTGAAPNNVEIRSVLMEGVTQVLKVDKKVYYSL